MRSTGVPGASNPFGQMGGVHRAPRLLTETKEWIQSVWERGTGVPSTRNSQKSESRDPEGFTGTEVLGASYPRGLYPMNDERFDRMAQDLAGTDVVGASVDLGRPINQNLSRQAEDRQTTGVIGASEGFSWAHGRLGDDNTNTPNPQSDLPLI
eukprot:10412208-Prorocentrum_lima.AAC.1